MATFGNLRANPVEQVVSFAPAKARYFKFIARHAHEKTIPSSLKSAWWNKPENAWHFW